MLKKSNLERAVVLSEDLDAAFDGKTHEYLSQLTSDFLFFITEAHYSPIDFEKSVYALHNLYQIFNKFDGVSE